jgi:hypothetical protein
LSEDNDLGDDHTTGINDHENYDKDLIRFMRAASRIKSMRANGQSSKQVVQGFHNHPDPDIARVVSWVVNTIA